MVMNNNVSQQGIQRVRFLNDSEEAAPPYAAMVIKSATRREDNNELMFTVTKPDADAAKHQDPDKIVFNQHLPVGAGRHGWCTWVSPAFAVGIGNDIEDVDISDNVGLAEGSWLLWRGGCTHTVTFLENTGQSEEEQGGGNGENNTSYGWVTRNTSLNSWVRWSTSIAGSSTSSPPYDTNSVTADILYWSKPTESDLENEDYTPTLELVTKPQEGGGTTNLELEIYHAGSESVAAGHGKATLLGGKWILDLAYCSS